MTPSCHPFTLARRAERMNPSIIREILKVTERPDIVSLAGGLPSADTFTVQAVREATEKVLREAPHEALQYAASEGFAPLREWVAAHLAQQHGMRVDAQQVLITNGSQQGLDLAAKVLVDAGSRVLVETPTYLGALQAFAPGEPFFAAAPQRNTLRLSFVTVAAEKIEAGIAALAGVLRQAQAAPLPPRSAKAAA